MYFYAINAGYKDDNSSQNYDFFVLERRAEDFLDAEDFGNSGGNGAPGDFDDFSDLSNPAPLSLEGYEIIYTNSSGNESGRIKFESTMSLVKNRLVLGFSGSLQYKDSSEEYLYTFSSSGLASTAGKLTLTYKEEIVDEICWGKITCDKQLGKFATSQDGNMSYRLVDGDFVAEKYYPEIDENAIEIAENASDNPTSTGKNTCKDLKITEVYTVYETSASEQFIELYNSGSQSCLPSDYQVLYKNKKYSSGDIISPKEYYVFKNKDLTLTKNPTSLNDITIIDNDGSEIDKMSYPKGQKAGKSYALRDINSSEWAFTFRPTPGEENIIQEFQTCEEGKVINEETGNCVNETTQSETVCPEGKYLNPETGRCKKIEEESTLAECPDGYERNPETNRCRKIQADGEDLEYAPKTSANTEYSEPKRFAAYGIVALALISGVIYVFAQFRKEILRSVKTVTTKISHSFHRKQHRRDYGKIAPQQI